MAKLKTDKYFITDVRPDKIFPGAPKGMNQIKPGTRVPPTHVMWLDGKMIPGAFYTECVWIWPETGSEEPAAPEHSHDFAEIVNFYGTDFNNLSDLGGEVELWVDGEKHIMIKSFLAYIPAGMKHGPLYTRNVVRPIFHFTVGLGGEYKR
jgi:hypothetical protein